jgi:galactokinase
MGHKDHLVPSAKNLAEVYSEDQLSKIRPRWTELLESFQRCYNHKPDLVARSPGRVNLIGEHIDYSLYDVLPMAVCVDCLVAVRAIPSPTEDPVIQIYNVREKKFPGTEIKIPAEGEITIDASKHLWTNYFMAGLIGAIKLLRERIPGFRPLSLQVLVDGRVPAGGGLSSSAAFVCASSLAAMKAHNYDVSQEDLFELAIVSERLVGVNSGG